MNLEFQSITKSFGEHCVLDAISASFEQVRSLVLVGPSGGGKSTLLRLVAGLETADAGVISVNGEAIPEEENALRNYRKTVGVVFQAFNLFPHLTALENLTLPLEKVHAFSPEAARDRATGALKRFRLEAHAGKRPGQLSGGQKQRVAIARAIAIRPKLLLFDEPTSALDPEMTAEVLDVIAELKNEGSDFLLVTHQMGFARRVADRVAFLSDGRLVECGTPEQVFDAPETRDAQEFLSRVLSY